MIRVKCPNTACGKMLRVEDKHAGKRGKCPVCGQVLLAPTAQGPAATTAPAICTAPPAPSLPSHPSDDATTIANPSNTAPSPEAEAGPIARPQRMYSALYYFGYNGGLLGAAIVAASAAGSRTANELYAAIGYWLCLAWSIVVFSHFWYTAWAAIQDGHTSPTPGRAVGFLFVPFLNIFWAFRAIGGYPRQYEAYCQRHSVDATPPSEVAFTLIPVLLPLALLLGLVIPVLGILLAAISLVLFNVVISKVCRAVNVLVTLEGVRTQGRT